MSRPALHVVADYPRRPRATAKRRALLANIMQRQKQGRLLSEIGAEFGSHMVRSVLLIWLFEAAA